VGEAPAILAGFMDSDGDAKVVGFPRSRTTSDESGVEEFILIVLAGNVLVKEFVSIVKVGVPLLPELSAGL
jgi:hypothetical protein